MNRYTPLLKKLVSKSIFLFILSTSTFAQNQDQGYFTISVDLVKGQTTPPPQQSTSTIQEEEKENPRFFTASAEEKFTPKGKEEKGIPSYFRKHQTLPEKFSGYAIELLQSDTKLKRDYPLFERFGSIKIDQLSNGKYSYCIIADFKKQSRVKIFASEVIAPHAPEATVWKYKRGKRKRM